MYGLLRNSRRLHGLHTSLPCRDVFTKMPIEPPAHIPSRPNNFSSGYRSGRGSSNKYDARFRFPHISTGRADVPSRPTRGAGLLNPIFQHPLIRLQYPRPTSLRIRATTRTNVHRLRYRRYPRHGRLSLQALGTLLQSRRKTSSSPCARSARCDQAGDPTSEDRVRMVNEVTGDRGAYERVGSMARNENATDVDLDAVRRKVRFCACCFVLRWAATTGSSVSCWFRAGSRVANAGRTHTRTHRHRPTDRIAADYPNRPRERRCRRSSETSGTSARGSANQRARRANHHRGEPDLDGGRRARQLSAASSADILGAWS